MTCGCINGRWPKERLLNDMQLHEWHMALKMQLKKLADGQEQLLQISAEPFGTLHAIAWNGIWPMAIEMQWHKWPYGQMKQVADGQLGFLTKASWQNHCAKPIGAHRTCWVVCKNWNRPIGIQCPIGQCAHTICFCINPRLLFHPHRKEICGSVDHRFILPLKQTKQTWYICDGLLHEFMICVTCWFTACTRHRFPKGL